MLEDQCFQLMPGWLRMQRIPDWSMASLEKCKHRCSVTCMSSLQMTNSYPNKRTGQRNTASHVDSELQGKSPLHPSLHLKESRFMIARSTIIRMHRCSQIYHSQKLPTKTSHRCKSGHCFVIHSTLIAAIFFLLFFEGIPCSYFLLHILSRRCFRRLVLNVNSRQQFGHLCALTLLCMLI